MLSIQPTLDRIFVSRQRVETTTQGGIVIPDSVAERQDIGTVVAVGPGKTYNNGETVALTVKIGDRIIFSEHAGQTAKIDGQDVLVMREDDVFAIIEGEL